MSDLIEYRFRLRNAADNADVLVVTSVRGDSAPWISEPPSGDGASLDWLSGKTMSGMYTGKIIDAITGGSSRLFTSLTEDAGKRQQLGQRKAFWEFRINGGAWTVLYAGRLSRYKLDNDIEWTVAVSDWMQAEHEFTLFAPTGPTETIAAFLARFPNRGCLFGGPLGTVLGKDDSGGWTCRVYDANYLSSRTRYRLQPVIINEPNAGYDDIASRVNEAVHKLPQTVGQFSKSGATYTTLADTRTEGFGWTGLAVLVNGTPFRALYAAQEAGVTTADFLDKNLLQTIKGHPGVYIDASEGQSPLTIGSLVRVRALTLQPSDPCPIYISGHPVDVFNTLETAAGIPVNSAALTTVKNIIGTNALHTLRVTGTEPLGTLLEREIYGPWGIGTRPDSNGAIEIFSSRTFVNTPPGTVIALTDLEEDSTRVFDLDTSSAIRQVNFEHHQLSRASSVNDGVTDTTERFERLNGDPGAIGTGTVDYTLKGSISFPSANFKVSDWVNGRAAEIFDRRGRGGMTGRTTLLRNGAGGSIKLGDEIIFQHPAVVNHNKRYGDDNTVGGRAMQVVHWTPKAATIEIELEDSGPNAQPIATAPTLTIAQSSTDTRHVALVTITNAATLIAAGYAVRLQFATTTGGVPASTDYTDIRYYDNAEIPTGAVALPNIFNGRTVYVRARSEGISFGRPSAYSTVQHIALDLINAPGSLSATPLVGDGSICDLSWTIGANAADCFTDIYLRAQGTGFSSTGLVASVPPGTTNYRLENLTPSALLIARVVHRYAPLNDQGQTSEVSFTATASTRTLSAPLFPTGFSQTFGRFPVLYGIAVEATEIPGTVEAAVAVETSPGSGTFGSFDTLGTSPSVSGDWTEVAGVAPSDGKLRRLKARHIGAGQTPSSYTSTVDIDPSVRVDLPPSGPDLVVTGVAYISNNARISFTSTDAVFYNINNGAFSSAGASPLVIAQTTAQQDVVLKATRNGQTRSLTVAVVEIGGSGAPTFGTATAISVGLVDDVNNTLRVMWSYTGSLSDKFHVYIDEGGGFSDVGPSSAGVTSFDWNSSIDYTSGAGGSPSVTVHAKVKPTDGTNDGSDSNTVNATINVV